MSFQGRGVEADVAGEHNQVYEFDLVLKFETRNFSRNLLLLALIEMECSLDSCARKAHCS